MDCVAVSKEEHNASIQGQCKGNMGKRQGKEMLFWTKEEYKKFAEVMMDKTLSYYGGTAVYLDH